MEYAHGNFKLGSWAATLGGSDGTEVDLYAGYNHVFATEGYSLDFMITNYTYTTDASINAVEYSISINTPYVNIFAGQMPEYFGVETASTYVSLSRDFMLGESGVVLGLSVGATTHADSDKMEDAGNSEVDSDGYNDYKVSLTKKKGDIEVSMFYTSNDLEEDLADDALLDDSVVGGSLTVNF